MDRGSPRALRRPIMLAMPSASSRSPASGTAPSWPARPRHDRPGRLYPDDRPTAARNVAQVSAGPYRIPHVRIDVSLLMTNKTPVGTYRGPGAFRGRFLPRAPARHRRRRSRHRSRGVPSPQPHRGRGDAVPARHRASRSSGSVDRQRRLSDDARALPRQSSTGRQSRSCKAS